MYGRIPTVDMFGDEQFSTVRVAVNGVRMKYLQDAVHAYKKHKAIRSYLRKLPRLLVKNYGYAKIYTPSQVRKTIERSGLDVDFSCYGIAIFSDRDGFDEFHQEIGETCDYDAMRAEVGEGYFHGHAGFSTSDVFAVSSESGIEIGHSGPHGDGNGHDAGGHH